MNRKPQRRNRGHGRTSRIWKLRQWTYRFKKLSDLFAAIDLFEVKKKTNATQTVISVRIRKGSGKKAPAVK